MPPLPRQNTQPQWSSLATVSPQGGLSIVGDITTPSGIKYPATATQLPYVGLKGLAIASPCAIAAPVSTTPAPSLSRASLLILACLFVLLAGTSRRSRRRSI